MSRDVTLLIGLIPERAPGARSGINPAGRVTSRDMRRNAKQNTRGKIADDVLKRLDHIEKKLFKMEKMAISIKTHALVINESDEIIFDETGNILMQELKTKDIISVPLDENIAELFGLHLYTENIVENNVKMPKKNENTNLANSKTHWTRNAILMLIGYWKDNESHFASSNIKNDIVWREIAKCLKSNGHSFSPIQCKDKFKNLKTCYTKKVDNMKANKNSGAALYEFSYFDEMDEIFGKKPNINPEFIASSSRSNNIASENIENLSSKGKKRKMKIEDWYEIEKDNQEARDRRHREKIKIQKEAMKMFKNSFDKLLEKFDK